MTIFFRIYQDWVSVIKDIDHIRSDLNIVTEIYVHRGGVPMVHPTDTRPEYFFDGGSPLGGRPRKADLTGRRSARVSATYRGPYQPPPPGVIKVQYSTEGSWQSTWADLCAASIQAERLEIPVAPGYQGPVAHVGAFVGDWVDLPAEARSDIYLRPVAVYEPEFEGSDFTIVLEVK